MTGRLCLKRAHRDGHGRRRTARVTCRSVRSAAFGWDVRVRSCDGDVPWCEEGVNDATGGRHCGGCDASIDVEKLRPAAVDSLIPLMPFNAFLPVLGAQTRQRYVPKPLLSDCEDSIETSLVLNPVPYEKVHNRAGGRDHRDADGIDKARPQSQGGYDPRVRACWTPRTRPTRRSRRAL
jgi:hypothetical protein